MGEYLLHQLTFFKMQFEQELEKLKNDLKEKWIDHCQRNKDWICQYMSDKNLWISTGEDVEQSLVENNPDEVFSKWDPSRPDSNFVIGVISSFDTEVQALLRFAMGLSKNPNIIIYSLGLHFDPFLEIARRELNGQQQATLLPATSELDDIREQIKLQNGEIT
ncbi:MAG: DUF5331 domain-containing protein [Limnothrix sp. RL_2_0]|nr:DUF5331 domain-containing protein [Limnothrix sp. RL_2_0]